MQVLGAAPEAVAPLVAPVSVRLCIILNAFNAHKSTGIIRETAQQTSAVEKMNLKFSDFACVNDDEQCATPCAAGTYETTSCTNTTNRVCTNVSRSSVLVP